MKQKIVHINWVLCSFNRYVCVFLKSNYAYDSWTHIKKQSSTNIPESPLPFFCGAGAWTQCLHLELLHQPFFVKGFFEMWISWTLLGLASNHEPPDLCILSS
jgi:hypothetical protein